VIQHHTLSFYGDSQGRRPGPHPPGLATRQLRLSATGSSQRWQVLAVQQRLEQHFAGGQNAAQRCCCSAYGHAAPHHE
jgi:hypothetical protein